MNLRLVELPSNIIKQISKPKQNCFNSKIFPQIYYAAIHDQHSPFTHKHEMTVKQLKRKA